jgi:hypothetical protein
VCLRLGDAGVAAPLLLWLTSLGPGALPAHDAVAAIADDRVKVLEPDPDALETPMAMDPALMRRYGLRPTPSQTLPAVPPAAVFPGKIRLAADTYCPPALAHLWPGAKPMTNTPAGMRAVAQPGPPDTTLAELARRCLVAMTNGLPAAAAVPAP